MDEVKAMLVGLISSLVTQGIKLLGEWMHKDLKGIGAFLTFVLTAAIVAGYDAAIGYVPYEYRALVGKILAGLITVLSGSGAFRVYAALKAGVAKK